MNTNFQLKKRVVAAVLVGLVTCSSAFAYGMNNAPCTRMADCIYTAAWWAFWR